MDVDNVESQAQLLDTQNTLPLDLDRTYNLVICTACSTALPFEWILPHLKKKHNVKTIISNVMEHLSIEQVTMTYSAAQQWITETWVTSQAVQGVPVMPGIRCKECHHASRDITGMRNHFASSHKGLKVSDCSEKYNVQMPFQGRLRKYIQIEDTENLDVEMDAESDWKQAFKHEFQETMVERTSSAARGSSDARLLNVFIAKVRWDLCVKDMNLLDLQKIAAAPVRSDRLHKVILCGRDYIHKCCKALNGGNMMLKRRLMSAGYISTGNMY
jgi:hypothetical protein